MQNIVTHSCTYGCRVIFCNLEPHYLKCWSVIRYVDLAQVLDQDTFLCVSRHLKTVQLLSTHVFYINPSFLLEFLSWNCPSDTPLENIYEWHGITRSSNNSHKCYKGPPFRLYWLTNLHLSQCCDHFSLIKTVVKPINKMH